MFVEAQWTSRACCLHVLPYIAQVGTLGLANDGSMVSIVCFRVLGSRNSCFEYWIQTMTELKRLLLGLGEEMWHAGCISSAPPPKRVCHINPSFRFWDPFRLRGVFCCLFDRLRHAVYDTCLVTTCSYQVALIFIFSAWRLKWHASTGTVDCLVESLSNSMISCNAFKECNSWLPLVGVWCASEGGGCKCLEGRRIITIPTLWVLAFVDKLRL